MHLASLGRQDVEVECKRREAESEEERKKRREKKEQRKEQRGTGRDLPSNGSLFKFLQKLGLSPAKTRHPELSLGLPNG